MVFENEVVKKVIEQYRVIWALGYASSLLSWDSETYMPSEAYRERGIARAHLAMLQQQLLLRPEFVELVDKASQQEGLNDYERGVVRVLQRAIRIAKALPPQLVAEIAKTTEEARVAWREAREKDDYSIFKPYLAKIIDLSRKVADHLGWEEHPYDALLDLHEEGLRTRDVDNILEPLARDLKRILEKVLASGKYPQKHPLEEAKYERSEMEKVNLEVLKLLGYPLGKRGRLDVSPHPMTVNMGILDVRITTRYEGFDFKRSLLAVVHEFGHALYELQIDEALMATPLASGVSMGIHEGQSRFWENIVGRSREFVEVIYPILRENLSIVRDYKPEDIYLYFNTVRPSLIRTEADEVTYNLHIVLRARLEKLMLTGDAKPDELPELWNQYMEELLGIKPKSYREGILQDIHWSGGMIGYFPSYTLGNLVAAQMKYHMMRELDLYEAVRNKDFESIKKWQREKIHKWGSTYAPKELLRRAFSEEYEAKYLIKHLEEKYLG
ncbi:MAG: carboxypeptidase M32 [Thermoprotei archaeon]